MTSSNLTSLRIARSLLLSAAVSLVLTACGGGGGTYPETRTEPFPATGKEFARYWLHAEHLKVEGESTVNRDLHNLAALWRWCADTVSMIQPIISSSTALSGAMVGA